MLALLLGMLLALRGAPSPQQASATAAVTGVVVDGTTGAPVAGAVVWLSKSGQPVGPQSRQLTDAKGRYAFTSLPAGDNYSLAASKFGFFDGAFGRDAPSNASGGLISLGDGQWFGNARIVLWRPAAIGGTVTDERGEPVVNVYVRVLAQRRIAGQIHLVAGPSTLTDDRGRYRISGLRPGKFFVSVPSVQSSVPVTMSPASIAGISEQQAATREVPIETALDISSSTRLVLGNFPVAPPPADGRLLMYPIAFHPSARAVADAAAVELKHAEERDGIDIRLEPEPAAQVAGKVQSPQDALGKLILRLVPAGLEELGLGSEAATTTVAPDGSFVFLNVAAGSYTIDAMRDLSEFIESGSSSILDSIQRPQTFPPRPPGIGGSGWTSESIPSGPAGTGFMTRSGFSANSLTGRTAVTVRGRDVLDVTLVLRPAVSVSGRIVIERDARQKPTDRPSFLSMRAEPANGDPRLGLPRPSSPVRPGEASDEFELSGLQPGRYLLRANIPAPWVIKSITLNGRDITDMPLDATTGQNFSGVVVTVTNGGATVSGLVVDSQGQPAIGAAALLFPVDPARWTDFGLKPLRISTTLVSNTGRFDFKARPAGDYFVVALTRDEIDAWQDPEFLMHVIPRATRVVVGWGETKTVDLRVSGGK